MRYNVARLSIAFAMMAAAGASLSAQRGGGGAPGGPPSPQASAPIDLTGYWVAIVNEDWRWRMVTPPAKDYASVPISPEGRKIADTWDISKDGSCLAYGAAALMRMPTRLNITWENDNTLKIDTDAGQQTRRLLFTKPSTPPGPRSLQGLSIAEWEIFGAGGRGGGGGGRGGGGGGGGAAAPAGAPPAAGPGAAAAAPGAAAGGRGGAGGPAGAPPARSGNLKAVTTNLSGGWLRKNGVPYSEDATVTEFYDRFAVGTEQWLVVTTVVADPKYLAQEFVTSSHFKREPNAAKWDPTPCKP
jgi:hypothetical protein